MIEILGSLGACFWFIYNVGFTVVMYVIFTDGYTSSKAKRARAGQVKHKSSITMYNKMAEMISNLSELLEIQELTDTTILQVILRNRNLFL